LEFPRPKFPNDPDIFVIGSRNGLGKTSVLECCAWGLIWAYVQNVPENIMLSDVQINTFPSTVRCQQSTASSVIKISNSKGSFCECKPLFTEDKILVSDATQSYEKKRVRAFFDTISDKETKYQLRFGFELPTPFATNYNGQIPNPSIDHLFLFFPDNRYLLKGTVPLKELQSDKKEFPWISEFKIQALEAIMGKSGLLEGQDKKVSEERFEFLNHLVKDFTECELSPQLKQGADSSLDIRVRPKTSNDSANATTYSFDGLSSGQKEMISTLFLIWENTRNASKVVLIDEPEQHLNAEWHRLMIHTLCKIAPWNQYIIATHSEHIMDAVDEDRRILLVKKDNE
jgi:AAA15 family ATPase/GTPase